MDPTAAASEAETAPVACLKLNSKIYPIYCGHNTVGRDPLAVVNLKDATISKNHAIITVFDKDSHYVSDFKSANGTRLDGEKLVPLKLYRLDNGASVKFGNVFCTYKKLKENESVSDDVEASQKLSESVYSAGTQEVRECSLPEGINFSEMPTQIFANPEALFNEMATQAHTFEEVGDHSSEASVDFATMQKAETQLMQNNSRNDLEADEPLSQIVPVVLNSKKVVAPGDSDTDDELTSSQVKPVSTGKRNVIDSDSETEEYALPIDDGRSKYEISDDSETDIEEGEEQNEETKQKEEENLESSMVNLRLNVSTPQSESKPHCEIAGPDHVYCQSSRNIDEDFISKDGQEKGDDTLKVVGRQDEEMNEQTAQLTDRQDFFNQPTQELEVESELRNDDKTTSNQQRLSDEGNSTSDQNEDLNLSNQQQVEEIEDRRQSSNENENRNKNDIFDQPTQEVDTEFISNRENSENKSKTDDTYLQPTQTLDYFSTEQGVQDENLQTAQLPEGEASERHGKNNSRPPEVDKNDDLLPTQALEAMYGESEVSSVAQSKTAESDDILPSTQALETLLKDGGDEKEENRKTDMAAPPPPSPFKRKSKRKSDQKRSDDEDNFLQPTQAMEALHRDSSEFGKVQDEMYEIFASQSLLATQQLVDVLDEDVIDDSISERDGRPSFKEPISAESVKKILEGVEDENQDTAASDGKKENNEERHKRRSSRIKLADSANKRKEDEINNQNSEDKSNEESKKRGKVRRSLNREDTTVESDKEKTNESLEEKNSKTKKNKKANADKKVDGQNEKTRRERLNLDESQDIEKAEISIEHSKENRSLRKRKQNSVENTEIGGETVRKTNRKGRQNVERDEEETKNKSSNGKNKRRRRQDNSEASNVSIDSETESKKEGDTETTKITRRRGRSRNSETFKNDENRDSGISCESSKRTGRRKLFSTVPDIQETHSEQSSSQSENEKNETQISSGGGNERRTRRMGRRKEEDVVKREIEENRESETSKKMKKLEEKPTRNTSSITSPRKRVFKTPSLGSEDEFVTKVPKLESTKQISKVKRSKDISSLSPSIVTDETSRRTRRLSANSRQRKREQEEEEVEEAKKSRSKKTVEVTRTPERSKRILKPKVAFTMMDNPELESIIRHLGGTVVDTVNSCTVLVTAQVKRTLKLLCAVAQGKPVCSPQWLEACKRAGSFVDPSEHILVDQEAEENWAFSLAESINRASKTKLLRNYTFQVLVTNAADVLKGAIEACGGKCVTRNLANCETENLIVVSEVKNRSKYGKIVKQNPAIKVVEAEAIFDGTLRQEFKFDDFLLS